jgi:hypothetical protein
MTPIPVVRAEVRSDPDLRRVIIRPLFQTSRSFQMTPCQRVLAMADSDGDFVAFRIATCNQPKPEARP